MASISTATTPNDWLLRVGDGTHFIRSSAMSIWGVNSTHNAAKAFLSAVKPGDRLWFVKGASKGHILAVATFKHARDRVLGPLISLTPTNEDLGWTETPGGWDTELHYDHLYNLTDCGLYSEIKSPLTIRLYNSKCKVELAKEYPFIVKYSKVAMRM